MIFGPIEIILNVLSLQKASSTQSVLVLMTKWLKTVFIDKENMVVVVLEFLCNEDDFSLKKERGEDFDDLTDGEEIEEALILNPLSLSIRWSGKRQALWLLVHTLSTHHIDK